MIKIKALEKLCEWASGSLDGCIHADVMRLADEIQEEIAEMNAFCERVERAAKARDELEVFGTAYMPLPLDAEGVPIHPGDDLYDKNTGEHIPGEYVYGVGDKYVYIWHEGHNLYHGISGRYPDQFRHRPRTLEDVLADFSAKVLQSGHQWGLDSQNAIGEYAEEIRELMEAVKR